MIRQNLTCRKLFLAGVLSFFVYSLFAADRYSVATGNWNVNSTWSATSGGAPGASFPVAGDNVFIEGGFTVTVTANALCAGLSIANGSTLTVGGFNLTVSGATTLSGTINYTSTTGTKTFTGLITINATGIWNNTTNNESITIRGGITNNGTFNAGTGTYTFNTNNQTVTGTLTIPNLTATGITVTNNGSLTVSSALSGTGGLTQAVNASLDLGGTSAITTFTASNNGNTVNYSGGAQSVKAVTYFNLTISGSGNKTMAGNVIVSGTLTLSAGTLSAGANTLTLNGPTIAGTPSSLTTTSSSNLVFGGTSAGVLIPTSVTALSGLSITNTSIVTLQSSLTVGGTFNPAGAGLSIGSNTLTLNGQVNCGTLVGGATSNITIGGAGTANLPSVTLNNLIINRTVSLCGSVTVGGTLTLTSGALSIGANTLTLSNAANLSYGTGSLTGGATSNLTIGTGANITLNTISGGLSNFNSSRNITLGASLSLNGTLTITAGNFTVGANTLTLNGPTIAGTPANLITTASSTLAFGGTTSGVLIPTSVTVLNSLSITNTSIVTLQSNLAVSGTFNPAGAGLSIGANTLTLNGQINCGTLAGGASSNIIIGGAGTASLSGVSLNNLTINRPVTMCGNITVGGTLTLSSGAFTVGANTLTLNGPAIAGTPANLTTTSSSGLVFGGSTAGINIPSSTSALRNLTINNTNGVTMNSNINLASNGILTLTSGILQAGTYTMNISNTAAAAVVYSAGSFVNVTTGSLQRSIAPNLTGTGNNYLFPIGEGNTYKAINLNDVTTGATGPILNASVNSTGATTGDNISIGPVDPRYWSLINTNSGDFSSARIELYETGLNATKAIGMSSAVSGVYSSVGGTSGASSIVSSSTPDPGPYFCIGTKIISTFYSYQTGSWNTPETWTSDPSGTLQIGTYVPGSDAIVVILPDRTVTLPANISSGGLDITINAGGFLDLSTYRFTDPLIALRGQGTLRLASPNFPASLINSLVNAGGGSVEYYNPVNFTLPSSQATYNNLIINTPGIVATQLSNITLNGYLYIKNGTFRINDNAATAKLTLTINGNVTVDNGAVISVGNGVTNPVIGGSGGTAPFLNYYLNFHTIIIRGDFTNNGTARFTNLNYPLFNAFPPTVSGPTSGAASVYFQGAGDNTLNCNGVTVFYNLIINKGTDQTYKLTVNSSGYGNFRLYGANVLPTDGAVSGNPGLRKALWIYTGTLILKGSLIIPSLSEGIAANSDYYIPSNGALQIEGVDVVVLSTADDYREINVAYGVAAPDNATIGVGTGGFSAVDIFGKLQINNGFLSTRESGGLITSSVASGRFIINGGTIDAKQFLSSTGSASYIQTGGLFILRGRFQRTPSAYTSITNLTDVSLTTLNTSRIVNGINSAYGSFNLENTNNIYRVSGGTIRIYDVAGTAAGEQEAFDVKSSSSNINVTGGTLEILPVTGTVLADAANYRINTTSPVFNLIINRLSSTSVVGLSSVLILQNYLNLASGSLSANNFNLTIGGNVNIESGTTYTPGTNTTTLNGSVGQIFTVNLAAALSLYNFTINKSAGVVVTLAGSQGTLNVTGNFNLTLGTLEDAGKTVNISGNVYNSGIHTGTGVIVLNGTNTQTIDGAGIFQNLTLNNTNAAAAPVSLLARSTINGVLTFSQDKLFNIGIYNLLLNSAASIAGSGPNRYIQTAGNAGDGGLARVYNSPAVLNFPVGIANYTPGTIGFNTAPTSYGSITVIPVNYAHPIVTAPNRSLAYFWRVQSSGFDLGTATVTHGYTYDQSKVVTGGDVTEDGYVAARFNRSTNIWTKGTAADVDETNNIIGEPGSGSFLESVPFIDGDYTAGDDDPTSPFGTPVIYYSRQSGLWSNVNTWSLTSHTVNNPPAVVPGASDIVIIGDRDSVYLSTNTTVPNTDSRSCAKLQIEAGSALDIGYNPSSLFSLVISHPNGNGNFRSTTNFNSPSTFVFPSGDFSDFNVNMGTTELYTTNPGAGTTYYLPDGVSSYGNLIISPLGGSNIIFPNRDLIIYGNLITKGQNADSWFAMSWGTTYPGPVATIPKTVTVNGNLDIRGGSFGWYQNGAIAQNIVVNGNVIVAPLSGIDDWGGASNQRLSIGGSLINNANGLINAPAGTRAWCRFTNIPVTFFGTTPASITNTTGTPSTTFGQVIVNKGSSQTTTLTCNIGGTLSTPADNWLTLQNGTFRYMRTDPGTDFTISTTTPFNIPSTAGLTIDYANASNRNILIGNASNNTGDMLLSGKLTLVMGNVYIGPLAAPANNNDIEYSGGGASAIEIQGGNLVVNGQIRRNTSTTNGILNYTQSGGSVIINGNNSNAGYAKLEVLNAGSLFSMSGGTITIVRGGGTTFGDLYLRPTTSSVSGGTVIFTQTPALGPVIDAAQTYSLDANLPLNDLTLTGKTAGTARTATLNLMVSPLVLNGSLTLTNNQSIFNSNNLNISLKGNLNNSGTYNYGTNKTTFNGGIQSITGTSVTNFYDLDVSSLTSLTVNGSFTVFRDLNILSGNTILTSNLITLLGNLTNNGSYSDDNTSGGVSLSGTLQQQVTGTGSFGRLTINNVSGAKLNNDISLQNDLVLTAGILDINKYQLTLSQNSSISGAPYSSTKMIKSDGVSSSMGVMKFFTASAQNFTFPVGVSGKYTPAIYSITANGTVGSIRVNPVDECNQSITDPTNALGYFWHIESSGISGFDGNLLLQYLIGDVAGTESNYVASRLILPGGTWDKAPTGPLTDNVNETLHQITFLFTGTNNLNGDYTAGNDAAIPDEVASYQTNSNGVWSNQAIWTPVGSSPPCPPGGPAGSSVIINHVVTADINYISVLNTTINNELRVVLPTYGHNLGYVDGNGKIFLDDGNLPGGVYTDFFDCSGNGTIEYGGSGSYTVVASQLSSLPNLFFTGTGTRILPVSDLTVCKRLVIDGATLDNSVNNRKLTLFGTFERYNTGVFNSGTGTSPSATVVFAGTSLQSVGGPTGNFSGTSKFNNIEINNPAGLNIGTNGLVEINNQLLLTNGIIGTSSTNRLVLLSSSESSVYPVGGTSTSFINGPLTKNMVNGDSFIYPIGEGIVKSHDFTLTSTSGSTLLWTVEYTRPNSTATSLTPPLQVCNTLEFWSVSSTTTATGVIKIAWDPMSDLTPLMTLNGITDMRVAEFSSGFWTELASVATGNNYYGDVATINNITVSTTPKDYTTASITGTLARASYSPPGPVCGDIGIPLSFVSFNPINLNYILSYTIDNVAQTDITVTSLPYTMPTPVTGTYRLTGFRFNNGTGTGVVDVTPVNVYAIPVTANAGLDQSLCGVSSTSLAGNNPAPYAGLWTIISGSGGSFVNSVQNNTVFNGILGTSYTLRWTISNGPCTSYDEVVISFPVVASTPDEFTAAPPQACQGTGGYVYTVPFVAGVIYDWSYSGTGHTINGTGNSVTIDFASDATGGTLSVTATNNCGTSTPRTTSISVPSSAFSYTGTPYCQNSPNPAPSLGTGSQAGTFSSTAGLVFVSTITGQINLSLSSSGTYIVTNTVDVPGCGTLIATSPVTISGLSWTGASGTDWNVSGNWSCGYVPYPTTHVQIPDVINKPVLNSGSSGTVNNLTIETGSSLTISGKTLQIAGSVTNNGTLTASNGTIEFNGSAAQIIGINVFNGNTIKDLIINNPSGVTMLGALDVTGSLTVSNGNLASNGNLTLLSGATQTAYINGSGSGSVTGNVTMQRYLSSAFGYKYISSPFQAATVNEFADDLDLGASFPSFFRYNENLTTSGWVSYVTPADPLNPLEGYAAFFGSLDVPHTADVSGVVNNGPLSVTLYNHNNAYTEGFNLVGNPYPSAIDWDAPSGWTKTNIDNALYYFKASTTDEYGGTYSTYINGISSDGLATATIPSMQGFFIHVSDGSYPVTGTLGLNNSVRITDLTHPFMKSGNKDKMPLIRLGANFADDNNSTDPMVIYFDEKAQTGFDSYLDAFKLMNTDYYAPSLYAFGTDGTKLSINALPEKQDTLCTIPLGLKTYIDGYIVFKIIDISEELPGMKINISDMVAGTKNDLLNNNEYKVYLEAGEYKDRFFLNVSEKGSEIPDTTSNNNLFTVYSSHGLIKVYVNTEKTGPGLLSIYNLAGQVLFVNKIIDAGYYEFNPGLKDGIYIVRFMSTLYQDSKKIFIQNR
jgi:hypothetical protein